MYQNLYMHAKSDSIEQFAYGYVHALLSGSREFSWVCKQLMHACNTSKGLEHDKAPHHEFGTNGAHLTKTSIYERALKRLALLESADSSSHNPVERSADSGECFEVPLLIGSSFS
jgi:hypothetical protein